MYSIVIYSRHFDQRKRYAISVVPLRTLRNEINPFRDSQSESFFIKTILRQARLTSLPKNLLTDIRQYHRILDLIVLCEQKDLGYDLGCLGIVIHKR